MSRIGCIDAASGPAVAGERTGGWPFPRPVAVAGRQPEPGTTLVSAERVGKAFAAGGGREVDAVVDVSLRLELGRSYLLRGPSGSGKTTLLSVLGCMVRPTAGRVRVAGRETTRLPEDELAELRRRLFGFVFQGNQLIRGLSALKNVLLPVLPRPELNGFEHRAASLLAGLGLADRAGTAVERLSGGEQQRVAIARALVNDPLVVIADEPTAHLDREAGVDFLALVAELTARGRLVLVASHDPELAGSGRFDRIFEMRAGRLSEGDA